MLSLEALGFTPELLNLCGIFALVLVALPVLFLALRVMFTRGL